MEQIGNKSIINFSSNFTETVPYANVTYSWNDDGLVRLPYNIQMISIPTSFTIIAHRLRQSDSWKLSYFIHKPKANPMYIRHFEYDLYRYDGINIPG